MRKRTSICNDGKKRTFSCEEPYYTIDNVDKEDVFSGFPKAKACVSYTEVKYDTGIDGETFAHYNNGLVGYQNFNFFNTLEEAEKDCKKRKKLTPKIGTEGYCDVFLIVK